jgi:hypothetical protein
MSLSARQTGLRRLTGGDGGESVLGNGEEVLGHGSEILEGRKERGHVSSRRVALPSGSSLFSLEEHLDPVTRTTKAPKTHLDQRQVEPEALSLGGERSSLLESLLHESEVGSLEERSGGPNRIGGVGDNNVEGVLNGGEVLESVGDVDGDLGVGENVGHSGEVDLGDSGDSLHR